MKIKNLKPLVGSVVLSVLLLGIGCSDGINPNDFAPPPNPEVICPPPPTIELKADPVEVEFGGSTTLSWKVSGADKIEIASSGVDGAFHFESEDLKDFESSAPIEGLKETTTFILTATKNPESQTEEGAEGGEEGGTPVPPASAQEVAPPPAEEGSEEEAPTCDPAQPITARAMATVSVKESAKLQIIRFEPENTTVKPGESTILHWEVVPSEAQVSIMAYAGTEIAEDAVGEPVDLTVPCEGIAPPAEEGGEVAPPVAAQTTADLEREAGEVVENLPNQGCVVVSPTQTTTYRLTAQLGDDAPQVQDTTITVSAQAQIEFSASPNPVTFYPSPVVIFWQVSPPEAKVTLTASPSDCVTGELPKDSSELTKTFTLEIKKDCALTLSATIGGVPAGEQIINITSSGGPVTAIDCSQVKVGTLSKAPVFMGETIEIGWEIPANFNFVTGVKIIRGKEDVEGATKTEGLKIGAWDAGLEVPASSKYKVQLLAGDTEVCVGGGIPVEVPVVPLKLAKKGVKAVRVVSDGANGVYVGLDQGFKKGGEIQALHYTPGSGEEEAVTAKFVDTFKGYDDITKAMAGNEDFMEKVVQTFPVNAVTMSPSGRFFMATTGAMLYQDKEDKSKWALLAPILQGKKDYSGASYSGSHPSCFGTTQSGKKKGEVLGMHQVCDMVVSNEGKFYAATDVGILTLGNVEKYIEDYKSEPWGGFEEGNPLFGSVVNDVEIVDGIVYAGGSKGLFKSADGGASWEQISANVVYSIAAHKGDGSGAPVVAGSDGGVLVGGELKTVEGAEKVFSVVVDPYDSKTILAGTNAGLHVSRNGGEKFVNVTPAASEEEAAVVVRSASIIYTSDPTQEVSEYYVYLATESGVMRAYLPEVSLKADEPPAAEEEEEEVAPEEEEPAEETPPAEEEETVNQ